MSAPHQYVTFGLDDEMFAIPVNLTQEILDFRRPARLPNAPPYMLGLSDFRGRGIPAFDLRVRLGLTPTTPTPHTRIIVMDAIFPTGAATIGFTADRVFEVTALDPERVAPAPDIGIRWRSEYISGVVSQGDRFVVLMDMSRLFSGNELAIVDGASTRVA